jgi:hypothetical protein
MGNKISNWFSMKMRGFCFYLPAGKTTYWKTRGIGLFTAKKLEQTKIYELEIGGGTRGE